VCESFFSAEGNRNVFFSSALQHAGYNSDGTVGAYWDLHPASTSSPDSFGSSDLGLTDFDFIQNDATGTIIAMVKVGVSGSTQVIMANNGATGGNNGFILRVDSSDKPSFFISASSNWDCDTFRVRRILSSLTRDMTAKRFARHCSKKV